MILSFNNGLGDQIQAIPIMKALLKRDKSLQLVTKYPELWDGICKTHPFYPGCKRDKRVSYVSRRPMKHTTQFQDVCLIAGVSKDLSPRIDWKIKNIKLVEKIKEKAFFDNKKKICLFKYPYDAMGQNGRFKEVVPRREPFDLIINHFKDILFVDIDTIDTSVTDLLDLAYSADCLLAQIGHFLPLADAFDKPILLIFAKAGFSHKTPFINGIRPVKFINKDTTHTAVDDEDDNNYIIKFQRII